MWTDKLADGGDAGYALVFKSETRLGREQAVIQLYCIGITLGMVAGCVCHVAECAAVAMGSGLGTGLLLRSPMFNSVGRVYDDNEFWEVPKNDSWSHTAQPLTTVVSQGGRSHKMEMTLDGKPMSPTKTGRERDQHSSPSIGYGSHEEAF
jgi:hypothetical protein